jgi:hypothetical protein
MYLNGDDGIVVPASVCLIHGIASDLVIGRNAQVGYPEWRVTIRLPRREDLVEIPR